GRRGDLLGGERKARARARALAGLHDLELGVAQPLRGVDVAHERGNTGARLRDAVEPKTPLGLLHTGEVHPLREGVHDLIEHMHDLGARALQLLDDPYARDESRLIGVAVVALVDVSVDALYCAAPLR